MAWAHPKFESLIASCGYDNKVKVWRRNQTGNWETLIFEEVLGESVNCIAWAPWEYGLILAAGTAEGRIHIFSKKPNAKEGQPWENYSFEAHIDGVNGICWGPSTEPAMLSPNGLSQPLKFALPPRRLASGGIDKRVRVWEFKESE